MLLARASKIIAESPLIISRYWAWLIVVWIKDVASAETLSYGTTMLLHTATRHWGEGDDEAERPKRHASVGEIIDD